MRAGPPPRRQQLVTIATMLAILVGMLVMRRDCAHGTARLFEGLEPPQKRLDSGVSGD